MEVRNVVIYLFILFFGKNIPTPNSLHLHSLALKNSATSGLYVLRVF